MLRNSLFEELTRRSTRPDKHRVKRCRSIKYTRRGAQKMLTRRAMA